MFMWSLSDARVCGVCARSDQLAVAARKSRDGALSAL